MSESAQIKKQRADHFGPVIVACLGVISLLIWRNYTLFFRPHFWAEDLTVYFQDARILGAKALVEQYAGYVQIGCRIIAWLAGAAPAELAPRLYATSFIAAIFATAFLTFTSPAFEGWGKAFASIALIGAPVSSEVFWGMLYTQWVTGPIVALAIYETPKQRWRAWTLLVCYMLVGFSSPFAMIAAPFIGLKTLLERNRFSIVLLIATCAMAFFHLRGMLHRFEFESVQSSWVTKLIIASSVLCRWVDKDPSPVMAVSIGTVTSIAAASYLWINRAIAARPTIYFAGYGVALLLAGASATDASVPSVPNQWAENARYFYLPVVLFIWTLIAIESRRPRESFVMPVLAGVLMVTLFVHTHGVAGRYREDDWQITAQCLTQSKTGCVPKINPSFLNSIVIPSDYQLRTLSQKDLMKFRSD